MRPRGESSVKNCELCTHARDWGPRTLSERGFDRLLIESVDETIDALLGERVREAFSDVLKNTFLIERNQIFERLDDFASCLEKIFGPRPSKVVGKAIGKRFLAKLGLEFVERGNWRLPDYVREARTKMSGRSEPVE